MTGTRRVLVAYRSVGESDDHDDPTENQVNHELLQIRACYSLPDASGFLDLYFIGPGHRCQLSRYPLEDHRFAPNGRWPRGMRGTDDTVLGLVAVQAHFATRP